MLKMSICATAAVEGRDGSQHKTYIRGRRTYLVAVRRSGNWEQVEFCAKDIKKKGKALASLGRLSPTRRSVQDLLDALV